MTTYPAQIEQTTAFALAEKSKLIKSLRHFDMVFFSVCAFVGLDNYLPTAKRVEVLARLCAEGYAGKMVLSHDANCWSDLVSEDNKRRTRPHWHYTHISDDILPALRAAGVTADQIEQMLVRNPRAIFEAVG